MSKAIRRHHMTRLKCKRTHHFGRTLAGRQLGKAVATPHPCSCYGCCNPRAMEGPTVQERRAMQRDRY